MPSTHVVRVLHVYLVAASSRQESMGDALRAATKAGMEREEMAAGSDVSSRSSVLSSPNLSALVSRPSFSICRPRQRQLSWSACAAATL